jgi:hypothetical protein
LTYIDSSIITTGVTGGVQAGVTKQLKVTIIPVNNAAIQANGKLIICSYYCYSLMYSNSSISCNVVTYNGISTAACIDACKALLHSDKVISAMAFTHVFTYAYNTHVHNAFV